MVWIWGSINPAIEAGASSIDDELEERLLLTDEEPELITSGVGVSSEKRLTPMGQIEVIKDTDCEKWKFKEGRSIFKHKCEGRSDPYR